MSSDERRIIEGGLWGILHNAEERLERALDEDARDFQEAELLINNILGQATDDIATLVACIFSMRSIKWEDKEETEEEEVEDWLTRHG